MSLSGANIATSYVFPTCIEPETYDVGAAVEILVKDVGVYVEEVENGNFPNAVGSVVNKIWSEMGKKMPGADFTYSRVPLYSGWRGRVGRSGGNHLGAIETDPRSSVTITVYPASDDAAFMIGTTFIIDGGMVL